MFISTIIYIMYLLLGHKLRILSELQACTANPLFGSVCTNCFEKWAYHFENVKDDSRKAVIITNFAKTD